MSIVQSIHEWLDSCVDAHGKMPLQLRLHQIEEAWENACEIEPTTEAEIMENLPETFKYLFYFIISARSVLLRGYDHVNDDIFPCGPLRGPRCHARGHGGRRAHLYPAL